MIEPWDDDGGREAMSAPERSHSVALTSDFLNPGWRAECSCGWKSPRHADIGEASRDFERHRAEVAD